MDTACIVRCFVLINLLTPFTCFAESSPFPFSVFKDLDIPAIVDGESVGQKLPVSGMASVLASETVFYTSAAPKKVVEFLQSWNPSSHQELGIVQHHSLPTSVKLEDFAALKLNDSESHEWLIDATGNTSDELNLNSETKKLIWQGTKGKNANAETVQAVWRKILFSQAEKFQSGGIKAMEPYQRNGGSFSLSSSLDKLWNQLGRMKPIVNKIDLNNMDGRTFYWEEMKVEKEAVFDLGAVSAKEDGNSWIVCDLQYYVSANYDAAVTLYCIKPEKNGSLIWRGDYVFSETIDNLRGVERMVSEKLFLQDIKKTNEALKMDLKK